MSSFQETGSFQDMMSEVHKIRQNCTVGYIGSIIGGVILFYYINSIKDCECVNKEYIDIIKKCFYINIVLYVVRCNMGDNESISTLLLYSIIIIGVYYAYNVRLLVNDIYKKNCECADTNMTYVMNIVNYIVIAKYAFLFSLIFLAYVLLTNR